MATFRFIALEELLRREPLHVDFPSDKISDYFAQCVFTPEKMQRYMPQETYKLVQKAIQTGQRIDRKIADQVASGMKDWAVSHGATHYTHWFHPLTGGTAEKHDAFFDMGDHGQAIEAFSGALLAQQEPDASSFPNGGLRDTFEARGYTAWDPSSPAFIIGKTLCIPTIFIAYTGEALDSKTPLLKSLAALDKAATEVCRYYDKDVTRVISTLGWEQEYFLIDEALYQARPDLALTGRTLMGHASAKDQQLEDHYFGSIPERVSAFMKEFEIESHKLGIPLKTRHNEVAPNQFECAPIFEEANLANDHNLLLMDIMRKIAQKHKFRVLFHEKPFAGINGSGKHNNWSMATNTGVNLLKPGKNPRANMQFLTFLVNVVKAVHDHGDLLRSAIMSASNQHRLGANEAPPAIISVFLGTELSRMLDELEERIPDKNKKMSADEKTALKLDIGKIPEILLDNTDRNRTSPFAFTGNRFEFRAVGSSENSAGPMTMLNVAVAERLIQFKTEVDALIEKKMKKDDAIFLILRRYIAESKAVRFEGNGYSQAWVEEAKQRGLTNITSAPESFKALNTEKSKKVLLGLGIFNERELHSRYEIKLEEYIKKIQIESRVLGDLASNHIIPTAIKYQSMLIESVKSLKEILGNDPEMQDAINGRIMTIKEIAVHISSVRKGVYDMTEARKQANAMASIEERSAAYEQSVRSYLSSIRYHIDKLELIVDDEHWPLPKYREMLFNR